jgi:DNA repair protein RecN (Recombination protein N)
MLTELMVQGLGVIEHAELSFGAGCVSITGETGAGKTLVVAAVSLLLGGRADRALVRKGSPEALVEGRFALPASHPAVELLSRHGILEATGNDAEVVVSRSVRADGKAGRARVNGRLVPVSLLGEIGPVVGEIAGQHEHLRISEPAWQRAALDSFAGPEAETLAAEVAEEVRHVERLARRIDELESTARERARERDMLAHEIDEITAVGPLVGESERLRTDAGRLERTAAMAEGVGRASEALSPDGGALEMLAAAREELAALRVDDDMAELEKRMTDALHEMQDVSAELARRMVEPDADALEATRARLDGLLRLFRRYGEDERAVLDHLASARTRADELRLADEDRERLFDELRERRRRTENLAARLGELRRAAAPRFSAAVDELLGSLALEGATLTIAIEERDLYEGGIDAVTLLFAANPGEGAKPIGKVASGGELSRLALALHLATTSNTVDTMIFDEVDAGVGGLAAQAVGRALARLADQSRAQVIVVTHLPQVAAFADSHYRVTKTTSGGRTRAAVEVVEAGDRVVELSRMMAGLPESERAREHAQELLEIAGRGGR